MKNLKNRFIICFDTVCDGMQAVKDENGKPVLYGKHPRNHLA